MSNPDLGSKTTADAALPRVGRFALAKRSEVLVPQALELGEQSDRLGRTGFEVIELSLDRPPPLEDLGRVRRRLGLGDGFDVRPAVCRGPGPGLLTLSELCEPLCRGADRSRDLVKSRLSRRDAALVSFELTDLC